MKTLSHFLILIFSSFLFSSCNGQSKSKLSETETLKDKTESMYVIISIPGGARAHIIKVEDSIISYGVGSIEIAETISSENLKFDTTYKEVKKKITSIDKAYLEEIFKNTNSYSFSDTSIVIDSYEYYLYINNKKIAFGYKVNINKFPSNLRTVFERVLKMTGKLYDIPGMS